jgi:Uma2 family endonuclease
MGVSPKRRMTADEFVTWAMQQPEGQRCELVAGEVIAMTPERVTHTVVKGNVYAALRAALRARGGGCQAFTDGVTVRVDGRTVYEPDASVRCGEPIDPEATEISDPLVLVEVVSPSSASIDNGAKLHDYMRLPSLRHYLVVYPEFRRVVHHTRQADGSIGTRVLSAGPLALDPPGIEVSVESFFED